VDVAVSGSPADRNPFAAATDGHKSMQSTVATLLPDLNNILDVIVLIF
jgi:hypothetical protein